MARGLAVVAALALAFLGCATGSPQTLAGATSITALALSSAVVERGTGGCVAICTDGTSCNTKTGLCEELPCRGRCGQGEHCEQTFAESKCVPGGGPSDVVAQAPGSGTKLPVVAPVFTAPNPNQPSPTIVPTAEQNPPQH